MTSASSKATYMSLFETPGTAVFFMATFLGRVPLAMKALGCVLLVEQLTGSYGLAGIVGATQTLVSAFASPQLGRFADRYGERTILFGSVILHTIGMIWLIAAAYADAHPVMLLLGAALIGGSTMPFGSLSRARWVQTVGKGAKLNKAYALESMADEMGFIIGPMLVVPLSVSVNAAAGLLVSLVMTIVATIILIVTGSKNTNVRISPTPAGESMGESVIRIKGIQVLAGSLLFTGIIFGAVEIVLVAFAEHQGQANAASFMAAIFAAGSLLGAIGYGEIQWNSPVDRRLKIAIWWIALGSIPILLVNTIPQMSVAVFITGVAISPSMIAANTLVEHVAPPKKLTEAFSWIGSAIATGAAFGSVIAGVMLDEFGIRGGQAVSLIGGLLSVVVVMVWARYLKTEPAPAHAY